MRSPRAALGSWGRRVRLFHSTVSFDCSFVRRWQASRAIIMHKVFPADFGRLALKWRTTTPAPHDVEADCSQARHARIGPSRCSRLAGRQHRGRVVRE